MSLGVQVTPDQAERHASRLTGYSDRSCFWNYWTAAAYQQGPTYDWDYTDWAFAHLINAGLTPCVHLQNYFGDHLPMYPENPNGYTAWVSAIVNRYKSWGIHRWAIENETTCPYCWGDTVANYEAIRELAYPVIKTADPNALVVDSFFCNTAAAVVQARAFYQSGHSDLALALMAAAFAQTGGELGGGILFPPNISWTNFWLQENIAKCLEARDLLIAGADYFDIMQYHWFGAYTWMPSVITGFKNLFPTKIHEMWELGTLYSTLEEVDDTVHARSVGTLLLTSVGEGSTNTIYFPYVQHQSFNQDKWNPGLIIESVPYMPPITVRPAEQTYRWVATGLDSYTAASRETITGAKAYKFVRPSGDLWALWTVSGETVVSVPLTSEHVSVLNIVTGEQTTEHPAEVPVGIDPVLVTAISG